MRMNPQVIQQFKSMLNQAKMAQNPQLFLNQLLMSNPQIAQVLEYIKQNGGNAQTAFYNYAKQMGLDPQMVLNTMQQ